MPHSKYDPEIMALRKNLQAAGVILLVLKGKRGTGGGGTVVAEAQAEYRSLMPMLLRDLADDIERNGTEAAHRLEWEDIPDGN